MMFLALMTLLTAFWIGLVVLWKWVMVKPPWYIWPEKKDMFGRQVQEGGRHLGPPPEGDWR